MHHSKSVKDVLDEYNTSETGLSTSKAESLLNKHGKNELPKKEKTSIFKLFIEQFKSPLEIILVITVILSFLIGETVDAIALIIIILVDVIIGTVEEFKARLDAEALLNMIKVTSRVLRDGKEIEIESSLLVVGDIILLESGDKISADARIIECSNFQVDESTLTGESLAVVKDEKVLKESTPLAERTNMIYAGTSVITGRALAVVVKTGTHTEIGKIAEKVITTEEEKSPLTIRLEKFSKQISVLILIVAFIITIILVVEKYQFKEILLNVIALSVSALPEGLALAMTMALTIASKRMAKKNVIVKKLNSVESLGSCTVIASDKTGTLTANEQTAKRIVLKNGDIFEIDGTGYNAQGKVIPVGNAKLSDAEEIAFLGMINNEAHLEYNRGKWNSFGDSIDIAFLALAKKLNVNKKVEIIERIPYESENGYSAVFYKKGDKTYCTVKGSLERVMSFSEDNKTIKDTNEELSENGFRVIAIANGEVKGTKLKDIKNLKFIGQVAFIDPIRKEVKKSIKESIDAGIKVVMITGDHPLTAFAIAKDLELAKDIKEVATGETLEKYRKLGIEEFDKFVSCIKVFSRVTPMDKLDIVESFKRQGEFVAVTGDGVNDAPAIKSANIGISMGSGTDVAKETASMIITNDNFTSIVKGIKEGRIAYSNIRKIILFLVGCGLAEVVFFILAIINGLDIPLIAIQLLWLNMVTDGLQDIALSFEKNDKGIMKEKPRDPNESLFSKDLIIEIIILGLTIALIVFGTWKYLLSIGTDIKFARSIIMMLMVIIQNINVLNCRSEKESIFKTKLFDNPLIIITIFGSIGMHIIMSLIPLTQDFLDIKPLSFNTIMWTFGLALIVIVVFEIYKLIRKIVIKEEV